jgi:Rnl2 family RNA ligase
MEHIKYSSIENTYRDDFIELIKEGGLDTGEWVVTEKIHGGQFSIYYDGSEIKASTRTTFLSDDMDFFNWQKVLADNRDKVKELYRLLKAKYKELSQVIVYGELFGGSYPHPEVSKVKNAKRLQKGVHYHPDNLFYAFDIRVDGKFLTVDECNQLFRQVGLFYAKPLFRGTMQECLKYSNQFPSKISGWLGLPPIDDNIAEGIVIKPVEPLFLGIGERVILKSKNEKFAERKAVKKRPKKPVKEVKLDESGEKLLRELMALVTENRLQNVLSKRVQLPAPVPQNSFGEIIKEFSLDIWEEFNKDFEQEYLDLDKQEQKKISKAMNQAASKLIKKVLFSSANH